MTRMRNDIKVLSPSHQPIKYSVALHNDLISGRKRAVAWGRSQDAHIRLFNAPYSFVALIDGRKLDNNSDDYFYDVPVVTPHWLKDNNTESIVIVVLADVKAFGSEIAAQIEHYGKFAATIAYQAWRHELPSLFQSRFLDTLFNVPTPIEYQPDASTVMLCLPNLYKGGADRQIVLLALGLRQLAYNVYLVTIAEDAPGTAEWANLLENAGVKRIRAPKMRDCTIESLGRGEPQRLSLMSPRFLNYFNTLVNTINQHRPQLAISFLDNANGLLGLAALQTGLKHLVMSARSVAPIEIPYFSTFIHFDLLKVVYLKLLEQSGFQLVCNSQLGRVSYQRWLGVPQERLKRIENALYIESFTDIGLRKQLGLRQDDVLVCGVMRLIETKRPKWFVDIIIELKLQFKSLQAIIIGDGPLFADIETKIADNNAKSYIHLLGMQENAVSFMAQSDALLHTSEVEGSANVLMEAKALGITAFAFDSVTDGLVTDPQLFLAPEGECEKLTSLMKLHLSAKIERNLECQGDMQDVVRMATDYLRISAS